MADQLTDHFEATYYIETKQDLRKVAEQIAEIETTSSWFGTGTPTELFERCHGQVGAVREFSPGKGEIDILFPLINLNLDEAAFPSLWLTMIGGGTHALVSYEKSRLLDFRLPPAALRAFPGPAFGPAGTRRLLKAAPGELLIGTIIKPTAGLTPQEVADLCYQMAAGGMRFIKDDEKMLNTSYCPLPERVRAVSEALKRAADETGKPTIYAPHITTTPEHLLDNAHVALENGATGLMVNFFAAGFSSLQMLRERIAPHVPIYAHCGGKEAFGRAEGQGVDPVAVARFARLLGGDYFRISTLGGYLVGSGRDEVKALAGVMAEPMGGIPPMMPAVSGGLSPKNLGSNLEVFGADAFMLAGTGVTMHPMGIRAGTLAMQQAAESLRADVPLAEYAATRPELAAALGR